MPQSFLALLRQHLAPQEWERLSWLTDGGRLVPFGPEAEKADGVFLRATEEDLEILLKAEAILEQLGWQPEDETVTKPTILTYLFERESPELSFFLRSLEKNGFTATTLAMGEETEVRVDLTRLNDTEFFRARELLRSIESLARRFSQGSMPGRLS